MAGRGRATSRLLGSSWKTLAVEIAAWLAAGSKASTCSLSSLVPARREYHCRSRPISNMLPEDPAEFISCANPQRFDATLFPKGACSRVSRAHWPRASVAAVAHCTASRLRFVHSRLAPKFNRTSSPFSARSMTARDYLQNRSLSDEDSSWRVMWRSHSQNHIRRASSNHSLFGRASAKQVLAWTLPGNFRSLFRFLVLRSRASVWQRIVAKFEYVGKARNGPGVPKTCI